MLNPFHEVKQLQWAIGIPQSAVFSMKNKGKVGVSFQEEKKAAKYTVL